MTSLAVLLIATGLLLGVAAIVPASEDSSFVLHMLPLIAGTVLIVPWMLTPDLRDVAGAFGFILAAYSVPAALGGTGSSDARKALAVAVAISAGGYSLGRIIGNAVAGRGTPTLSRKLDRRSTETEMAGWRIAAILGGCVALVLISLYLAGYGGLSARLAAGYGAAANLSAEGLGPFAAGFDLLFIVIAVGLAANRGYRRGIVIWLLIGILSALYLLRVGSRGGLLELAAAVLIGPRLAGARPFIRRRWVVIGVLSALGALAVLGIGRFVLNAHGTRASLEYGVQHVSWSNLDPTKSPELTAPVDSIEQLVDDPSAPALNGSSWIAAVTGVIPSAVAKPPPSPAQLFVTRYYASAAAEGAGRGLSPIVDGYWNFGFPGVFLELLVYGIAAEWLSIWIRRRLGTRGRSSPLIVAAAAISWAWLFTFARIDFATASRALITRLLVPVLLLWAIHHVVLARNARRRPTASLGRTSG